MAKIYYARVDEFWRRGEKYAYLEEKQHRGNIAWQELQPDAKNNWISEGLMDEFETFLSIGTKEAKLVKKDGLESIFKVYSRAICSNGDAYVFNFNATAERLTAQRMVENFKAQGDRWRRKGQPSNVEEFLEVDEGVLKWVRNTKRCLVRGKEAEFDESKIRESLYRPFCKQFYFFDRIFNEEIYQFPKIFPTPPTEVENRIICLSGIGHDIFRCQISNLIVELKFSNSANGGTQCFPFYTYDQDGTHRRENITDWALAQFRAHYHDQSITKWDIFHYVYSLLHHPFYRERYSANLKRELPRIPYAPDFQAFAQAGARLADIHVNYEQQPEYPLERIENPEAALDWRVVRMKLARDKRALRYNDFLTLDRIPPETFDYRLGNRSALEWVVDQYQLATDKRSGITNDPNRADDPQYILRLIGQVITVSLETVRIVRALPDLGIVES